MYKLKLYHFPRACSRVTLTAFEEAGFEYEDQVVNIFAGEQKSPEYLKINPDGKVPTLIVDDKHVITQNASIQIFLHGLRPDAGLLPATDDPIVQAQQRSDLIWLSSTLHPIVRQILMTVHFTDGDPVAVKAKGVEKLREALPGLEARFADGGWWYGNTWSIVDVYANWCLNIAIAGDFSFKEYPAVAAHFAKVMEWPSVQKVMAKEEADLKAHGIQLPR
ncbi:MAG: glutathione S-transferase family protein [Pseudomonadota bacterium]